MKHTEDYITEIHKQLADNINEFSVDEEVKDLDGSICIITGKSKNTIEVLIEAKSKEGADCKQWFDMKSFNKRFKK